MESRVLFARVGWMHYYRGLMPDDRPVGGGNWNVEHVGGEVANFAPISGKLLGYVEPMGRINLWRIDPDAGDVDRLHKVLVVFVAKRPTEGGQVVVGWYRNATVLQQSERDQRRKHYKATPMHNLIAKSGGATLLPLKHRTLTIPAGYGGFGQSNLCYVFKQGGKKKSAAWMGRALEFVNGYASENLLKNTEFDEQEEAAHRLDAVHAAKGGQGFAGTPAERRAVERRAMTRATAYFKKKYPDVKDVSSHESFDLLCTGSGADLRVEVKGTTGLGDAVFLTRREVEVAKKYRAALYVLHSVKLLRSKASGGEERVLLPWNVAKGKLRPTAYSYTLP